MPVHIECGIDLFLKQVVQTRPDISYGLVTNRACIDRLGMPVTDALIHATIHIKKIFSPEHGYKASGADGVFQPDTRLINKEIPIVSLYSDQFKPTVQDFEGLDAMMIDLPNIGSRYYTYLWTMDLVLAACNEYGLPVIILDRPNPLSGLMNHAEGPLISPANYSFIGNWSIPVRFGLTLGELALLLKKEKKYTTLDIFVIKATGWTREMNIFQSQYPFVPPSPAITEKATIWTYPALCYLEATNISEGRGTAIPFQVAIAPWIDAGLLMSSLKPLKLDGVLIEPIVLTPNENKYAGVECTGVKLLITDLTSYRPVRCGMLILAALKTLYSDHFKWKPYPTMANPDGLNHLERLIGDQRLLNWLEHDPLANLNELDLLLDPQDWATRAASILLYE
jgi:uncharacterized protein YbbC (DUF1343 family)